MTTLKLDALRACIPRLAGHGVLMTHTVPSQFTFVVNTANCIPAEDYARE